MNKLVYWMVFPTFLVTQPLSDSSQVQVPLTADSSYASQIGTQDHFFVSIPCLSANRDLFGSRIASKNWGNQT